VQGPEVTFGMRFARVGEDKAMTGVGLAKGVAVVTGAAGGMGSQCARLMAEAGWPELLLCDLDQARLDAVARPLLTSGACVETLACDIAGPDLTPRLLAILGEREIGAMIHAAGLGPQMAEPNRIFDVNLDAGLRLLDVARLRMAEGGAVVLFASVAGYLPVTPEADRAFEQDFPKDGSVSLRHLASSSNDAYLLSKRAAIAIAKREARRLFAERKARIVSVSPGLIETVMTKGVDDPQTMAMLHNAAMPRLGRPEEVAAACVFLCSPSASFITGCDLKVDGGELAGLGL
jgi:NAD(P)-dependent dehydrogenase (short-subunit alcohol dehydrogenase family)